MFVSASIGYAGGRKDSNSFSGEGSDYLKGMGNAPGSVIALAAGRRVRRRGCRTVGDDRCTDHAHIARVRRTRRSGGAAAACGQESNRLDGNRTRGDRPLYAAILWRDGCAGGVKRIPAVFIDRRISSRVDVVRVDARSVATLVGCCNGRDIENPWPLRRQPHRADAEQLLWRCRHQFPILKEAGKFPGFYTAVECHKVAGGHLKCFRTGLWLGDPEWVP